MRKSSTNTFSGGLSLDLNPINTPNTILTDCVNGTLITFNGDELILQNDAGNSKISIHYPTATLYDENLFYRNSQIVYVEGEDGILYYKNISGKDEDNSPLEDWQLLLNGEVSLSEGFYPIGVKEYGGVLYIVSAKNDKEASKFIPGVTYNPNDVVYINITGKDVYYKCLSTNAVNSLPITTNGNWEYIGDFLAFNNYFGTVEFGSYPSPEFGGIKNFEGQELTLGNILKSKLYSPQVINDVDFKAGASVKFKDDIISTGDDLVSYYSGTVYKRQFYKVKLLHQLENGYVDLTGSVWAKYRTFKGTLTNETFWFNDADFEYFCPTKYKGKLAISLEIEDFVKYTFAKNPIIEKDGANYKFSTELLIGGTNIIESSAPIITLRGAVDQTILGEFVSTSVEDGITINKYEYTIILEGVEKNEVLNYTITPTIFVDGINVTEDVPDSYVNKYIIEGQLTVIVNADQITFLVPPGADYDCDVDLGIKIYKEIRLINLNGDMVDENLVETIIPHSFILEGSSPPVGTVVLGEFSIVNNIPKVDSSTILLGLSPWIISEFENFDRVVEVTNECNTKNLTVKVVNQDGFWSYPYLPTKEDVVLIQNGESITATFQYYGDYVFPILAKTNDDENIFSLEVKIPNYQTVLHTTLKLSQDGVISSPAAQVGSNFTVVIPTKIATVTATINLNVPIFDGGEIKVTQLGGVGVLRLSTGEVSKLDDLIYTVSISPGKDFTVSIYNGSGFFDMISAALNIEVNTSFSFGLIGAVSARYIEDIIKRPDVPDEPIQVLYVNWRPERFLGSSVKIKVLTTADDLIKVTSLYWTNVVYGTFRYEQVIKLPDNSATKTIVDESPVVAGDFDNISAGVVDNFVKKAVNDYIFLFPKNVPYSET